MAVAMRALDAKVETLNHEGEARVIPIAELHRLPGKNARDRDLPQVRRNHHGSNATHRPPPGVQVYRKVRDRGLLRLCFGFDRRDR